MPDQTQPAQPIQPPVSPWWQSHEFWSKNAAQLIILVGTGYALYTGHELTPDQKMTILTAGGKFLTTVEGIYHFAGSIKNKIGGLK